MLNHWCQWQHHVTSAASSIAPLQSLDEDNQYGVQCNFIGYVMPVALAPHDAYGVINGTIAFLRSRQSD